MAKPKTDSASTISRLKRKGRSKKLVERDLGILKANGDDLALDFLAKVHPTPALFIESVVFDATQVRLAAQRINGAERLWEVTTAGASGAVGKRLRYGGLCTPLCKQLRYPTNFGMMGRRKKAAWRAEVQRQAARLSA